MGRGMVCLQPLLQFHRMRSAMGACEALRERYASAAYRAEYAEFKKKHGKIDPKVRNSSTRTCCRILTR
ncbi:MAG: hypothetical protein Udaeo2_22510 [Candidatus Udaeobacter sp.]|nr:MAG: hypothetical protein Udaeo2_22510 [Candidatus Udaeobacter sp.]